LAVWWGFQTPLSPLDAKTLGSLVQSTEAWHAQDLHAPFRGIPNADPMFGTLPFHLGVHLLDLEVALFNKNWHAASFSSGTLAEETEGLLPDSAEVFKTLQAQIPAKAPPGDEPDSKPEAITEPTAEQIATWMRNAQEQRKVFEVLLEGWGLESFRLGGWAESTRLVALAGDQAGLEKALRGLPKARRIIKDHSFDALDAQQELATLDTLRATEPIDAATCARVLETLINKLGTEVEYLD